MLRALSILSRLVITARRGDGAGSHSSPPYRREAPRPVMGPDTLLGPSLPGGEFLTCLATGRVSRLLAEDTHSPHCSDTANASSAGRRLNSTHGQRDSTCRPTTQGQATRTSATILPEIGPPGRAKQRPRQGRRNLASGASFFPRFGLVTGRWRDGFHAEVDPCYLDFDLLLLPVTEHVTRRRATGPRRAPYPIRATIPTIRTPGRIRTTGLTWRPSYCGGLSKSVRTISAGQLNLSLRSRLVNHIASTLI